MNNHLTMYAEFERQKKVKATAITAGIKGALLLIFIFYKWPLPRLETPVVVETMEVNLGTDDVGSGDDQPMLPGEPAPAEQAAYTPPQPVPAAQDNAKDIETDDRDESAPAIRKPVVTQPNATKIDAENKTVKVNNPTPQPVVNTAPPKPQPKAVLGRTVGGTGNGGNGADRYEPGSGEGAGGGSGDQGRPGGDPNGRSYTGNPRNLGVRVVNIPSQSFEDDFTESGKVMLDIVVNASGRLVSATYQPRGSTISNRKQIEIARRRAAEIRFPSYEGGFKQTLAFNFSLKN